MDVDGTKLIPLWGSDELRNRWNEARCEFD